MKHPMKLRETNELAKAIVRIEGGAQETFTAQHIATLQEWIAQYADITPRENLVSAVRSLALSHEHLRTDKVIELQKL